MLNLCGVCCTPKKKAKAPSCTGLNQTGAGGAFAVLRGVRGAARGARGAWFLCVEVSEVSEVLLVVPEVAATTPPTERHFALGGGCASKL